jgi:hypothetical protein
VNEIIQQVFDAVQQKYTQKPAATEHPEAVGNAADSTSKK